MIVFTVFICQTFSSQGLIFSREGYSNQDEMRGGEGVIYQNQDNIVKQFF